MEDHAVVGVNGIDDILDRTEGRDDQRHLVLDSDLNIRHQARIGVVDDQVDAIGGIVRTERRLDLIQPLLIAFRGALVEGGEGADHARFAGGNDQLRP